MAGSANVALLAVPGLVREEYCFPAGSGQQHFVWRGRDAKWHILMGRHRASHAGVTFSAAYDYHRKRERTVLAFRMRPRQLAKSLDVGLVDGGKPGTLVKVPLADYATGVDVQGVWGVYAVPLKAFPDQGSVITEEHPDTMGLTDMDWSNIRGLRFTSRCDMTKPMKFTVSGLRFGSPHSAFPEERP
jgi:hypothetical protein